MSTSPIIDVPADIKPTHDTRSPSIPLCTAIGKNKRPCRCAALRGEAFCRHHSELHQRKLAHSGVDSISLTPLPSLIRLDIKDSRKLEQFRQGLMAHVGKGTIGVQEARAMHELAMAIHNDAHAGDGERGFHDLASSIARALDPTPGGGIAGKGKE